MKTSPLLLWAAGLTTVASAQSIPTSSNLPIIIIKTNGQIRTLEHHR